MLEEEIFKTIENFNLTYRLDRVVVAFSGGADSVSLLHFFAKNYIKERTNIVAAHLNHNLRGEESLRDERFVYGFCENLRIKLFVRSLDVKSIARKRKLGLEECGRNLRYEFFNFIAKETNSKIATAHTLSDSIETVFFNLVRGTGLAGICGVPMARGNIIRPMINVTRTEVEDYIKRNKLSHVTDSSNFSQNYSRNKIRLKVVPVLKEINPSMENSAKIFLNNLRVEHNFMSSESLKAFENLKGNFEIEKINAMPEAIKMRVLKMILENIAQTQVSFRHVLLASKLVSGKINGFMISGGRKISNLHRTLALCECKHKPNLTEISVKFKIEIISKDDFFHTKKDFVAVFDFERGTNGFVLRNRLAGDIFSPPGRKVTKKLKKFLNEVKIPVEQRDSLALLACGGEVVWVEGIGVSQKYVISEHTTSFGIIKESP
ncbi:MAG: tRNA lysidine(34) synthetase TilS [Oscillospiraceae bacterium]|nr:tRNA lysidine(34) synthetase TilS [Oscillospiraceae bacterium]